MTEKSNKIDNNEIKKIIETTSFNFISKNDCIEKINENLKNQGLSDEQIKNKSSFIEKSLLEMLFNKAINIVRDKLKSVGTPINSEDYDGIIVKKLPDSDIIPKNKKNKGAKQSDIRLNKNQVNMFPYLNPAPAYLDNSQFNNSLKNFYILEIPITLNKSNLEYLKEKKNKNRENIKLESNTTVTKDNHERIVISSQRTKFDGEYFKQLRDLLYTDDYLIILKNKEEFKYEAYGIKSNNVENNEEFFKLDSEFFNIKTKTLINSNNFKEKENEKNRIKGGENILIYGVPGCGKSWAIENEYCNDETVMERVVFHQDYDYSDFIGQILPNVVEDNIKYEFTPGPFTSILKQSYNNPDKQYFLVIEEINRGNAPAIFGDIFQLLDRKKEDNDEYLKGTSEYEITNPNIAKVVYGDKNHKIRIPSNLSIIATMNTSDQNVFTLDTAFQRRWNMRLINNSFDNVNNNFKNTKILDTNITWEKFCSEINNLILENNKTKFSSEDKRMGTYFVEIEDLQNANKFSEKVLKYLWDDVFKFSREEIFNVEQLSLEFVINQFNNARGFNRFNIFTESIKNKLKNNDINI